MIDLTNIAVCLTALIAAVVTAFFLPWLRERTSQQELAQLVKWVEIAVCPACSLAASARLPTARHKAENLATHLRRQKIQIPRAGVWAA